MEKFYSSKTLLKLAGVGDACSTFPPSGSAPGYRGTALRVIEAKQN